MNELLMRLAALPPEKQQDLFEKLGALGASRSQPPLAWRRRTGPAPASFAQERLWVLDRLTPGRATYNIPYALRIDGSLNVGALERSLNAVVLRHEVLRTTFPDTGGVPIQRIAPHAEVPVPVVELRELPAEERESRWRALATEEARRPFDLAVGPLVRARLLRLGDEQWVLLVTFHHIVFDLWSEGVLWRELGALYRADAKGEEAQFPPLAVQYADYAVWQREWLAGEALERQLCYWREQLAGAPPLELPTDFPRPPVWTDEGAVERFGLPRQLWERLATLGREAGCTPFITLLTGFAVLLSRYSGQEDVCVGTPISGRNRTEVEGLVGFFLNTLVVRARLNGRPTFREALGRVREAVLGAFAHQDLPFEKLVADLEPARDLSRSPLFQAMFVFQERGEVLSLEGCSVAAVPVSLGAEKFDLTLFLRVEDDGAEGGISYRTDLLEVDTARRMAEHFRVLLADAVAQPDLRVDELAIMTAEEQRRVVVEWNDTGSEYPRDRCIHQLFEEQAEKTPEAAAVVFEGQQLTYHQLDQRANQLAHYLRGLGAGPEVRVGIAMERSLEMVLGLLGILKAGGAYLPIDTGQPVQREAFMLTDAAAPVLLTQDKLRPRLPDTPAKVVCLDADWGAIARESPTPLASGARPENLAYVLFTSGSTGAPKGVAVPHRAVVRLVKNTNYLAFSSDDVFLQFAPLAFDASTLEIWGPLLNGGRLEICPPGLESLVRLGDYVRDHRVTTLWLTAALFHLMVDARLDDLAGLRYLLAGGDVLSPPHVVRAAARLRGQLINGYGPTENTTFTTCHAIRPGDVAGAAVPIGRPVANTEVYVLDPRLHPVPVGVLGELYAGGAGLARGYLLRPELTAERFVPDPFSAEPGARLYRTGDRVRYLASGEIEFLGRLDHQVKLRGFRIELGEIESALLSQPSVREAVVVVVAREDVPGDKRLVAYVVARDGAAVDMSGLRDAVAKTLPGYMVPSAIVPIEAFPLTPSGKVDRKALPPPTGIAAREVEYVAPRSPLEHSLAEIWSQVLGIDRVGVDDNFFGAGGNSLHVIRVATRAQERGLRVAAESVFRHQTIAELAAALSGAVADAAAIAPDSLAALALEFQRVAPAPAVEPVSDHRGRDDEVPVSFGEERRFRQWLTRWAAGVHRANDSGVTIPGPLDAAALERSFHALVARHAVLRSQYSPEGDRVTKRIVDQFAPPLAVEDLRATPNSELMALLRVAKQISSGFDITRDAPLIRGLLLRLRDDWHWLVVTVPHAVFDERSVGIFWAELQSLYAADGRETLSTADPPTQYADVARWQRRWHSTELVRAGRAFWNRYLDGALGISGRVPADFESPQTRQNAPGISSPLRPLTAGAWQGAPGLAQALESLARHENTFPFSVAFAAFAAMLARLSGCPDVTVCCLRDLRNAIAGCERIIGDFTSTVFLRVDTTGAATFRDLVARVSAEVTRVFALPPFELIPFVFSGAVDLFRTVFNFVQHDDRPLWPSSGAAPLELSKAHAMLPPRMDTFRDIECQVGQTKNGGIAVRWVHNADRWQPETARRRAEQLGDLLQRVAVDPTVKISEL